MKSRGSHLVMRGGWLVCLFVTAHASAQPSEDRLSSRPLYRAIQQALDTLSQAEIAQEEATLTGQQEEQLATARQQCRTAIAQLVQVKKQLAELLRAAYETRRSERDANSWTVLELESLQRNLKLQLARGYRNQALCYAEESVDRVNSLSLALQQLPDVVSQPLDDTSVWRARVEQLVCLRLLKKLPEAERLLAKWQSESPPTTIASRLAGEQLQIRLEERDFDNALRLVRNIRADHQTVVPETDDTILEVLLAAQQLAERPRSKQLLQRALAQLRHISASHGPFWQRRAEYRIGLAIAHQVESDDTELLNYAASSLYATGKSKQAVALYERIAKIHDAQQQQDQQFKALETAAAIVRTADDRGDAMQRFRRLAVEHSEHERAATAHLIAIGLAAQSAAEAAPALRTVAFQSYLDLLNEHLKLWPDRPSATQVKAWQSHAQLPEIDRQRAQSLAKQGKREAALALYRELTSGTSPDAVVLEEYAELLAQSPRERELREGLDIWHQIEKRSKPGGPRWWRSRRARLALLKQLGEGERAQKLEQLTKILYPASD